MRFATGNDYKCIKKKKKWFVTHRCPAIFFCSLIHHDFMNIELDLFYSSLIVLTFHFITWDNKLVL